MSPHPLPDDTQTHEAAQDVPVGQALPAMEGGPEEDQFVPRRFLRPAGEEKQNGPLRPLISSVKEIPGPDPGGVEHGLSQLPLPGGEEHGGAGNILAFRLLVFVPDAGQQEAVLRLLGALGNDGVLIHVDSASYITARNRRPSPAGPDGCPPR